MIVSVSATPLATKNDIGTGLRFSVLLTTGQMVNTDVFWSHDLFDRGTPSQVSRRIATEVAQAFNSINADLKPTLTRN